MKVNKLMKVFPNSFHMIKLIKELIILFYIINISKAENSISKIILTIKGNGTQKILGDFCPKMTINYPDDIYANNIYQSKRGLFVYNLTEEINNITISWNRQITYCRCMFYGLSNITYVDLSFFNTSNVTSTVSMFEGCSSLMSINLSNFDTSNVTFMNSMFSQCFSLKTLNLSNFDTSNVISMNAMFYECVSLTSLNLTNFNTSKVTYMRSMFHGCVSLISLDLSNFDTSNVIDMYQMFYKCARLISLNLNNFDTSNVIDMYQMFYQCESLISLNLSNFDTLNVTSMTWMFDSCDPNLKICVNETKTHSSILSELKKLTKDCQNTCFINIHHKLIKEKYKCIDYCSNDTEYIYEYNNICYKNCPNGTHISSINEYLCEDDIDNNKKVKIVELFSNDFPLNNNNITKDDIENDIREEIKNGNLNELINQLVNNEREDLIFENNNIKYEITTTDNYNEYKNISIIKLGECENILKKHYNISLNESLIIFKIDIYEEGSIIPTLEYEVYDMKNNQLDLNACKDIKIELLLSCIIDENEEFKYNLSSEYYNDICYTYSTENGSDIILSDRRNEYIDNNMSLCENNCEYGGYKSNIKKSLCECEVKTKFSEIFDIDKEELLKKFININENTNFKIMKCFKELFTPEGLIKNIATYIIFSIILANISCTILFIKKGKLFLFKIIEANTGNNQNLNIELNINKIEIDKLKNAPNAPPKKKTGKNFFNNIKMNIDNLSQKSSSKIEIMNNKNIIINNETNGNNIYKDEIKINDLEINMLPYNEAIKFDKRAYINYYMSLLKRKQIIIFAFYLTGDYNSRSIKISLFLFTFSLNYAVNAMFFNDNTMHKIYIDEGKYDLIYHIRNILYSTLISNIIGILLKYLALTENYIIDMKKNNNDEQKIEKIRKQIKIKIVLFFILNFLFLIFFWYYISCFGAIYKNTQIHLLKDTLITFGFSMLYPIGLCFLPGIFRIPSLRAKKQDKECLYRFSFIIQNII